MLPRWCGSGDSDRRQPSPAVRSGRSVPGADSGRLSLSPEPLWTCRGPDVRPPGRIVAITRTPRRPAVTSRAGTALCCCQPADAVSGGHGCRACRLGCPHRLPDRGTAVEGDLGCSPLGGPPWPSRADRPWSVPLQRGAPVHRQEDQTVGSRVRKLDRRSSKHRSQRQIGWTRPVALHQLVVEPLITVADGPVTALGYDAASIAAATASVRLALSTWRFSIIRPSTVTTPRPSASASVKASMTRLA